jgi:hypothetical protein
VINDILLTVGSDNTLIKFDLIQEKVIGTYKSKFPITSIRLLVPVEKDEELAEIPDRTSVEE